jgi:hypothetical protein
MFFILGEREIECICSEAETKPSPNVYLRYQVHKFRMEPRPQQLEFGN